MKLDQIILSSLVYSYISMLAPSLTWALRKLPGKSDTFERIREKKKIFVDKSKYIQKLMDKDEKFYFISRPHKFGKSNFLQMLRAFFVGNESLFRGLDVPGNHNWNGYSVIYFDFARANIDSQKKFLIDLSGVVVRAGKSYNVKVNDKRHFEFQLRELILDLSEKRAESVVVLVDNFDRPVRRNIERGRKHAARELNECLQDFFELLKGVIESLKLVVVTGVTNIQLMKFSSIVSNFCDITNDPEFSAIVGFTHEEIISYFYNHIQAMADEYKNDFKNITNAMKKMYGSYCFASTNPDEGTPVLNPNSVLSCLESKKVDNYWCRTPTKIPDYIVKYFRENRLTTKHFHNNKVLRKTLEKKYDFEKEIPMEVYLILHGYLTYRGYDAENELFTVGFANKEMEQTFLDQILDFDSRLTLTAEAAVSDDEACSNIKTALVSANIEDFIHHVNNLLKKKTRLLTQAITEEYPLTSLVESILRASAVDLDSVITMYQEDHASPSGDIDIETLNLPTNYVMEFKWRKTAAIAMNQLLRYANTTAFQTKFKRKPINLVGVNFHVDRSSPHIREKYRPISMNDWIKVRYLDGACSELEASHPRYLHIYASLILPGTSCNILKTNYTRIRSYYLQTNFIPPR